MGGRSLPSSVLSYLSTYTLQLKERRCARRLPPLHHRVPGVALPLSAFSRDAEEDDRIQRPQRPRHVWVPVPPRRAVVRDDEGLSYCSTAASTVTVVLRSTRFASGEGLSLQGDYSIEQTTSRATRCLHRPAVDHHRVPLGEEVRGHRGARAPLIQVLGDGLHLSVTLGRCWRYSRRRENGGDLFGLRKRLLLRVQIPPDLAGLTIPLRVLPHNKHLGYVNAATLRTPGRVGSRCGRWSGSTFWRRGSQGRDDRVRVSHCGAVFSTSTCLRWRGAGEDGPTLAATLDPKKLRMMAFRMRLVGAEIMSR